MGIWCPLESLGFWGRGLSNWGHKASLCCCCWCFWGGGWEIHLLPNLSLPIPHDRGSISDWSLLMVEHCLNRGTWTTKSCGVRRRCCLDYESDLSDCMWLCLIKEILLSFQVGCVLACCSIVFAKSEKLLHNGRRWELSIDFRSAPEVQRWQVFVAWWDVASGFQSETINWIQMSNNFFRSVRLINEGLNLTPSSYKCPPPDWRRRPRESAASN